MATQNYELPNTASSRASLVDFKDGEKLSKAKKQDNPSRRRARPNIALIGLLIHLIISAAGVAISVLIVHFKLQVSLAGTFDLVARVLLFVASCMGIFYVLMHAFAAREQYIRSHGSPQIFGYFTVAVAVLIMRLAVPVWTGSVVLTSFVGALQGFNIDEGLKGNVVWIQLVIASLGLISLIVMVVITETTERPFATSLLSKRSFLKAASTPSERVNTFDLSVSRAGYRSEGIENGGHKSKGITQLEPKHAGFDRSTINTPESSNLAKTDGEDLALPRQDYIEPLVRVRSQPIPTPLEAVFTSDGSPLDAQESPRKLAWHPRRESQHGSRRPQLTVVPIGARPRSSPRPLSSTTQQESVSERSSIQTQVILGHDETWTASNSDITIPPSPALGTPIAIPASTPLRIANPDEDVVRHEEPPSLAKLLGQLSTRAAARRRNSLLVRQAELAIKSTMDGEPTTRAGSRAHVAAVSSDRPGDNIGGAMEEEPVKQRNSLVVRQADLDVRRSISVTHAGEISVTSLEPSTEFVEIPRPPETINRTGIKVDYNNVSQPSRLKRSNTSDPLLVRNFSRPGAPRPRTAGGEEDGLTPTRISDQRGRNDAREDRAVARRSRSLPPTRKNRSTAEGEDGHLNMVTGMSEKKKGSQPLAGPRFSPFPKTLTTVPPFEIGKVKGLGQGSTRRLDERIEKWMNGVPVGQG